MTGVHRPVITVGPGTICRLCCGTTESISNEMATGAVDGLGEAVTLVAGNPVAVDELWRAVLQSAICGGRDTDSVLLVHPSWWRRSWVEVVTAAASTVVDTVVARPRTWVLARAASGASAPVVVEIAADLVVVTGATRVAEPRCGPPHRVAAAVVSAAAAMLGGPGAAVVLDAAVEVGGAPALATMIAGQLRAVDSTCQVVVVDDTRLGRLAAGLGGTDVAAPGRQAGTGRGRLLALSSALAVAPAAVVLGAGTLSRPPAVVADPTPAAVLVEGRVAMLVPAGWSARRVTGGPGSARVEVVSPSDPEMMLHLTQAPTVPGGLNGVAEVLKDAIEAAPAGAFVDFDPDDQTAGRPAVTYREVRGGRDIRWTVLVEEPVRISVGCQSRRGDESALRDRCEQAIRSAHRVG